jgi:hypothetical protein
MVLPARAQAQAPDCTVDVELGARLRLDVRFACRSAEPIVFEPGGRVDPKDGIVETRYQVDLTNRNADAHELIVRGQGALATLGTWLAEPRGYPHTPVIDIRVQAADGLSFAAGLPRVDGAWRLEGARVAFAGYTALGRFALEEIPVAAPGSLRPGAVRRDGVLRLAVLDGVGDGARADLVDWVKRTVEAESNYWQGFTAPQMLIGLVPTGARGPAGYGRTVSGGGASVMVEVARDVDRRRLFTDWVLVHELIHTGMPFLRGRSTWFMEGAATYVEPIIRARAGWKHEDEAWHEWMENMPRGVPAFARGLASASGRENYWAGALFMLMADVELRRETKGAKGLEDCLAGALWGGFEAPRRATVGEYAQACDRATGTSVVSAMVDRYQAGAAVDLDRYWKELGVAMVGGRVELDDTAPLARWRRMIVMGPDGKALKPVRLPWPS